MTENVRAGRRLDEARWKEPTSYWILLAIFAASRVAYYALGVRFDARPLRNFFQILDPELLRHRLLESLFYLHMQPPGYNLYLGLILKMFPGSADTVFHIVHIAIGAGIVCLVYMLMRESGVRISIALPLAALFIVSPGVVLFENFLLHEYMVVFLLLAAAQALYRFFADESAIAAAIFFACCFLLFLIRSHFHLIYVAAAFAAVLFFARTQRRVVVAAGILPLLLACAINTKNLVLFGSFASSTWMGMNMDVITAHQLTPDEARSLLKSGVISPVALIDAGEPIGAYRGLVAAPAPTGIPVLDEPVTSTGATNFNNLIFLEIGRRYMRDGFAILRHYPRAYGRSIERAWFAYFLPTGDFPFFGANREKIYAIDRFFNVVFFGQWKDASDRKALRAMEDRGHALALVLYTGTFLMIGLPLLWIGGNYYLVSGIRARTLDRASIALLAFLLLNIAYLTGVSNFLSSFENNRYRFQIDAFYLVLAGILMEQIWRRFFDARVTGKPRVRL